MFLPADEQPQEVELLVQKNALGTMFIKRAGLHTHKSPIRHFITFPESDALGRNGHRPSHAGVTHVNTVSPQKTDTVCSCM